MTLVSYTCDFKFSERLYSKAFQDGYTSDQINKIDQLVTPCFAETGGYAFKKTKNSPAAYVFQINPGNRIQCAQVGAIAFAMSLPILCSRTAC